MGEFKGGTWDMCWIDESGTWMEGDVAMGYCRICGELVKIIPGPTKNGKEQGWYPLTHQEKDRPESRCPGSQVPL